MYKITVATARGSSRTWVYRTWDEAMLNAVHALMLGFATVEIISPV